MMNRLHPADIVSLYKKFNVSPGCNVLIKWQEDRVFACAVGICLIGKHPKLLEKQEDYGSFQPTNVELALEAHYVTDFCNGFDGLPTQRKHLIGFEDGKAARTTLLEAGYQIPSLV